MIYSTPYLFGIIYIILTIQNIAFTSDKNKSNILYFLIAIDSRSFLSDSKVSTFLSYILNNRSPLYSSKYSSSDKGNQDTHKY